MESKPFGYLTVKNVNVEDICCKIINNFEKTGKVEDQIFTHEFLGEVTAKCESKFLTINFKDINKTIQIFQKPIILKDELTNEEKLKIFNEASLRTVFNVYSKNYDFYNGDSKINFEEALKIIPKEIKLKKIKVDEYSLFVPLNYKNKMPEKGFNDIIEINKLTPLDINSLNLIRNQNIEIILDNREDFIKEIKDFIYSDDIVLKIFGCDGIGKSLSFLYLTTLINDFQIIYFNLKEINLSSNKLKTIEFQLMSYFSTDINDLKTEEIKNKLLKLYYQQYKNFIENLEKNFAVDSDFWMILEKLIEKNENNLNILVCIIDQYKLDNDPLNKIEEIQKIIKEKTINVKLIVSSSLNDKRAKFDFIGILKNYEKKKIKNTKNIINEQNEKNENLIDKKCDEIFKDYSPHQDYINDMEIDDKKNFLDYFPRIKIFMEKTTQEKDENNFIEESIYNAIPIIERTKIKYINKLISIENIENEKQELISLLDNFDYNPKYYYKFKIFSQNYKNFSYREIYPKFLQKINKHISQNIKSFYRNYNFKVNSDMNLEQIMISNLVLLFSLIEDNTIINFTDLISLIEPFPLKYVKIIPIQAEKKNIINIDTNICNNSFKLEYSFPFIRFVISRLIYDQGNHGCLRHINQNAGLGIFLEIQIKKSIIIEKILGEFEYRSFWSFDDLGEVKHKDFNEQIDIFNLKEINLDDINRENNKLYEKNYYICPEKSNNKLLDSILLIPDSKAKDTFILIAFQITLKKNKIYSLAEYHEATSFASSKIKGVYGIEISKKYFVFVLAKDYNNTSTQTKLLLEKIPFIFYSTAEKKFFQNDKKEITCVNYLFDDNYKVKDFYSLIEEQTFGHKRNNLILINILLNRKRKKDSKKISKNLFCYLREKIFEEKYCLRLSKKIKDEIIINILNKKKESVTIEYISKINFSRISEIPKEEKFLGIFFYKKNYFVYYKSLLLHSNNNLEEKDKNIISSLKEELNNKIFFDLENELNINESIFKAMPKLEEIPSFNELKKNSNFNPSDVFIFYLYEMIENKIINS